MKRVSVNGPNKTQVYRVENGDKRFDKNKGKAVHMKTLGEIVQTIARWVKVESTSEN